MPDAAVRPVFRSVYRSARRGVHGQVALPAEQFARLNTADGDYLSLAGITPAIPSAAGFTLLWRGRMTQDTNSARFLQFRTAATSSVRFTCGRLNAASGNDFGLQIWDQDGTFILNTTSAGDVFQAADGVRTYLFGGSQAGGNIYVYRVDDTTDAQVGATLTWAAGPIGFTDNGTGVGDVDKAEVGRESVTTRSDHDTQRLAFWTSFIDFTNTATRRTLCSAIGIPELTMPGTPLIDLTAAGGAIESNAGSLADLTVNGAVEYVT